MDNNIYNIYQGEDFDIYFKARNSLLENIDISDIDISVALINTLKSKVLETGINQGITLIKDTLNSFIVSLSSTATESLPSGDYSLSVMLLHDGKKAIEQVKIIRVLNSPHK